jgi:hypothetical protein
MFQDVAGGVDVRNPLFHAPSGEPPHLVALFDGDGEILVPGSLPIGFRSLVEKNGSAQARRFAQDLLGDAEQT